MRKLALHWWILIAMVLGVGFGYIAATNGYAEFVSRWVQPIGDLFLRLLKMIAVPLVLFSLIAGVASLSDTSKLARLGGKTVGLYLGTTAIAITIGLLVVNFLKPGSGLDAADRDQLRNLVLAAESGNEKIANAQANAKAVDAKGYLQQFVEMVPNNPFQALAETEMLQVVFFALIMGVVLTRMQREKAKPAIDLFQTLSDAVIEMVHLIMKIAPVGVFALLAGVVASIGKDVEVLKGLGWEIGKYMLAVVAALLLHAVIVYGALLKFVAKVPITRFAKAMVPAQLLAFSSSSSGATLPVTIDCVEKGMGVEEEASSFVLPLGATINMDGTGLYQGVAAVFIATMYNMNLGVDDQLRIVLTAALASIGTAAVPGVGIVMLTIVLTEVGVDAAGIALVLAVDRPLDMCRTVINVTGDATVCTTVAATEGMLRDGRGPL